MNGHRHELSNDPENSPETVAARGGETGHNVRYVLIFGTVGAMVALAVVAIILL